MNSLHNATSQIIVVLAHKENKFQFIWQNLLYISNSKYDR